jgi:3',5'-cyclic AMP phosphodiesterase CpdA
MFRIAHISDLHIQHPDTQDESQTLLQGLIGLITKQEVVADHHDLGKFEALCIALVALKPDVILVTGDLTNFGDPKSFDLALKILEELQERSCAKQLLCIPGNHDGLCDRAAALRKGGFQGRALLQIVASLSHQIDMTKRLATRPEKKGWLSRWFTADSEEELEVSLEDDPDRKNLLEQGSSFPFLDTYVEKVPRKFGIADPSKPVFIEAGWGGEIAIFLFNSTNDGLLMCNEGRIGPGQYNRFNSYLFNPKNDNKLKNAVRLALLHHHPISAPSKVEGAASRGFDTMRDGTEFLSYVDKRLHIVLHGHQHVPYNAKVSFNAAAMLNLVGAGSATAGGSARPSSFNVIDLISPFQGRLQRFDYTNTGYDPRHPDFEDELEICTFEHVRLSKSGSPLTAEDIALRSLVRGNAKVIDQEHAYDLLAFDVRVTKEHLYKARYRRQGCVVDMAEGSSDRGIRFLITGSPSMPKKAMNLKATDAKGNALNVDVETDHPNQKMLFVKHRTPLFNGATFDVTLEFEWQVSINEPVHFDGVNLGYFKHPVRSMRYCVLLPWEPTRYEVVQYGVEASTVRLDGPGGTAPEPEKAGDEWRWCFEIPKPKALSYLISYPP